MMRMWNVITVKTVYHPDSFTKSIKVEMCYIDKTEVLSEDFWPQGIGCRLWQPKRSTGTEEQRLPSGHPSN